MDDGKVLESSEMQLTKRDKLSMRVPGFKEQDGRGTLEKNIGRLQDAQDRIESTKQGIREFRNSHYFDYPHAGWWRTKEEIAGRMSEAELWYARFDCNKTAEEVTDQENKYRDEGSIYHREIDKRLNPGKRGPHSIKVRG